MLAEPAPQRADDGCSQFADPEHACPEIACLRGRLPEAVLAAAEAEARRLGVGADEVLIASGRLSAEAYGRALAGTLGLPFLDLTQVPRRACLASRAELVRAADGGVIPVATPDGLRWVIAARGAGARRLIAQMTDYPDLRDRLAVTTPEDLRRFVHRHEVAAIGWLASEWLRRMRPLLSAGTRTRRGARLAAAMLAVLAIGALAALAPFVALAALQVAISAVFLAWAGLRLTALAFPLPAMPPAPPLPDRDLPHCTLIAALYDEAATLPGLIEALRGLDYPAEKLTILLVLEADDAATRAAATGLGLGAPFEVILAPAAGPRTKPKALNAALPFARGEFVAVFDAEDRPEPDQLRLAAATFAADHDGRLGCLQARLTIDNTDDGWLTALYTAEYAGLYDALLPGLAAHRLPIPLGGSSNHFRLAVLREAGAWDPHNVTEDADLGTRLARLGHGVAVIASSTYEEAPANVPLWLRQRTRWFKGWMQTWLVHMRRPGRLLRDLGPGGFLAFHLMGMGSVAAALLQPFAWALIGLSLATGTGFAAAAGLQLPGLEAAHWLALGVGYGTSILVAMIGLARRRLMRIAWRLVLMPAHWALLSLAAWRAVFQLLRDPYRWEKTAHGLGRSSRRRASPKRGDATDNAANPPRPLSGPG